MLLWNISCALNRMIFICQKNKSDFALIRAGRNTVLYCIVEFTPFMTHLVLTHEYGHYQHRSQWQDWCPPPNNHNPNILFNFVSEDFPPLNLNLITYHCCTILPNVPFSPVAAVTRAVEVEESKDMCPSYKKAHALWNHPDRQVTAKP